MSYYEIVGEVAVRLKLSVSLVQRQLEIAGTDDLGDCPAGLHVAELHDSVAYRRLGVPDLFSEVGNA